MPEHTQQGQRAREERGSVGTCLIRGLQKCLHRIQEQQLLVVTSYLFGATDRCFTEDGVIEDARSSGRNGECFCHQPQSPPALERKQRDLRCLHGAGRSLVIWR